MRNDVFGNIDPLLKSMLYAMLFIATLLIGLINERVWQTFLFLGWFVVEVLYYVIKIYGKHF